MFYCAGFSMIFFFFFQFRYVVCLSVALIALGIDKVCKLLSSKGVFSIIISVVIAKRSFFSSETASMRSPQRTAWSHASYDALHTASSHPSSNVLLNVLLKPTPPQTAQPYFEDSSSASAIFGSAPS